ncbi:hypothetical protein BP6252_11614 [Coleophoma cylindrospora]|uniref:Uncharacterized protein n=1 Tax=Coleophoma cylindrospora TaxID=1849047 RepID=A0A3D8QKD7_9HELO|nr:hypothetical protein BP6252_11614 [Coleophoma cylindrospora]
MSNFDTYCLHSSSPSTYLLPPPQIHPPASPFSQGSTPVLSTPTASPHLDPLSLANQSPIDADVHTPARIVSPNTSPQPSAAALSSFDDSRLSSSAPVPSLSTGSTFAGDQLQVTTPQIWLNSPPSPGPQIHSLEQPTYPCPLCNKEFERQHELK